MRSPSGPRTITSKMPSARFLRMLTGTPTIKVTNHISNGIMTSSTVPPFAV